jgi:ABC-2 type transport system permease protein
MTAALRYELVMMLRKRSLWIVNGVIVLLLALVSFQSFGDALQDPDARESMARTAFLLNLMLPIGYGCLLADRLIRDARLNVAPVLDATPASGLGRLAGKYLGVCAAAAIPLAIVYFGFAAVYAATGGRPIALAWAGAAFAVVIAPAVLFVGAFALTVPLLMPAPLFRVLFVGYWFWGNAISPSAMPTPSQSLLAPIGDYPVQELLGWDGDGTFTPAGPVAGASLNFLRPEASPATAWLSIALLFAIAALVLAGAHALRTRTTR